MGFAEAHVESKQTGGGVRVNSNNILCCQLFCSEEVAYCELLEELMTKVHRCKILNHLAVGSFPYIHMPDGVGGVRPVPHAVALVVKRIFRIGHPIIIM